MQCDRVTKSGNVRVFDDMLVPSVICETSSKLTGAGKKTKRLGKSALIDSFLSTGNKGES